MSISPACIACGEELEVPGAIHIAPPNKRGLCAKYHICVKCDKEFQQWLFNKVFNKTNQGD